MKQLKGLNGEVHSLDGRPVIGEDGKPITLGTIIANTLARGTSSEPARAMNLALRIYNGGDEVEMDDADFDMLLRVVQNDQVLTNFAKLAAMELFTDGDTS